MHSYAGFYGPGWDGCCIVQLMFGGEAPLGGVFCVILSDSFSEG